MQVLADEQLEDDFRQLVRLAVREDFAEQVDWTTVCLIDQDRRGNCLIVPRQAGICAGLVTLPWILDEMQLDVSIKTFASDGELAHPGQAVASIEGSARDILSSERLILNTLCRMFGIATLTSEFVGQVGSSRAQIFDTRKTTLGWRRLDKYAVRCGGGINHRTGLFDAFLIKDNHLALAGGELCRHPGKAVTKAKSWAGSTVSGMTVPEIVEIEVDTLDQLREVLPMHPDIVLLDNFTCDQLRIAVELRNTSAADVQLEASGNVTLDTVAEIAACGVDRISSGALTHAARWLDLGLDWSE